MSENPVNLILRRGLAERSIQIGLFYKRMGRSSSTNKTKKILYSQDFGIHQIVIAFSGMISENISRENKYYLTTLLNRLLG